MYIVIERLVYFVLKLMIVLLLCCEFDIFIKVMSIKVCLYCSVNFYELKFFVL